MGKEKRNWIKIVGITIIVLLIGFFIIQYVVKSKIESFLTTKLPENIELSYGDLSFSLWKGNIELSDIKFTSLGKTIQKPNVKLSLKNLAITDFGYWSYLVSDVISIDDIYLNKPDVIYYHNADIPKEEYQASQQKSFDKRIKLHTIKIEEGQVKVFDSQTDSLKLQTENLHLNVENIIYDEDTKNKKIPIEYGSYEVFFDSFFAQLGEYEDVTIQHASLSNEAIDFKNFRFYTKYSKEKLSQIIPFERDHYNLEVDSILVEQPQIGTLNDTILKFESPKVSFFQPDFKVYRDKLITDDQRIKPLYSKMLRDLKMALNLENVEVLNAFISYSEKVKTGNNVGTITFSKFNADIKNISNTYKSPTKTTLDINTQFMEQTPLKVVWSFDVNNESDLFEFKADMGKLQASKLNLFMEPNLNIRLEGELDKTYFTISGTDNASTVDFKVEYEDFDVVILKSDGKEENKILSNVLSLFVSKNSKSDKQLFKEATKEGIERSKTKSVFNFIWISVKAGLLKTMTI